MILFVFLKDKNYLNEYKFKLLIKLILSLLVKDLIVQKYLMQKLKIMHL